MFFQVFPQTVGNDIIDNPFDFTITELCLRLAFKLRFPYFDADDRRQSFTDIITGKIFFVFLDQAGLTAIIVDRPGKAGTETGKVGAPFFRKDIVDKA